MGHFTFCSLIKTDPPKTYRYGKELMAASSYDDPPYQSISDAVGFMTEVMKRELPKELYELGAEVCQAQIDCYPWIFLLPTIKLPPGISMPGRKKKPLKQKKKLLRH